MGGVMAAVDELVFSKELSDFIDEWKEKPGNLIMVLHRVQEEYGYISREVAVKLSVLLKSPLAKIYGVITFYHFFKTSKPGKYSISLCMGTACYLKGGEDLLDEARSILGIAPDEVTTDGLFSIDPVRCLGCCGLAPVLMIGKDVYGKVSKEQMPEIIAKYQGR
jgi:NADH:ubiquinone oxidoreductase subunit E